MAKSSNCNIKEIFSDRVNRLIGNKTIRDVANGIGLSESTFSGYINGRRSPDFDTVKKIADYFDVPPAYLVGWSKSKTKNKEITEISNYVGLSDTSIEKLHKAYESKKDRHIEPTFDFVNLILDSELSDDFDTLCSKIRNLKYYCSQYRDSFDYKIKKKSKIEDFVPVVDKNFISLMSEFYQKINLTRIDRFEISEIFNSIIMAYLGKDYEYLLFLKKLYDNFNTEDESEIIPDLQIRDDSCADE